MPPCQNGGEVCSSSLATPLHETRRIWIQASGKCIIHFSIVDGFVLITYIFEAGIYTTQH